MFGAALGIVLLLMRPSLPHHDPTIQRALDILGPSINPIRPLTTNEIRGIYALTRGAGVPPAGLNAFRIPGDPTIYMNTESIVYRRAATSPSMVTTIRLAATLLHERVHDSDGEAAASRRQADFVRSHLTKVSRRDRQELEGYWRTLEARAVLLARAEKHSRR